jgi:hypothetical protein
VAFRSTCALDCARVRHTTSVAIKRLEFWPPDLTKLFRSEGPKQPPTASARSRLQLGRKPGTCSDHLVANRWVVYWADTTTQIPFTPVSDANSRIVFWFVDSDLIGSSRPGEPLLWHAKPGNLLVREIDEQGRAATRGFALRRRFTNSPTDRVRRRRDSLNVRAAPLCSHHNAWAGALALLERRAKIRVFECYGRDLNPDVRVEKRCGRPHAVNNIPYHGFRNSVAVPNMLYTFL